MALKFSGSSRLRFTVWTLDVKLNKRSDGAEDAGIQCV